TFPRRVPCSHISALTIGPDPCGSVAADCAEAALDASTSSRLENLLLLISSRSLGCGLVVEAVDDVRHMSAGFADGGDAGRARNPARAGVVGGERALDIAA